MNITDKNMSLLIRCLGMLGSDQPGEVLNAASTVNRIVASMGVDWETLLTPPEEPPAAFTVNVGGKPANGTAPPPPPPPGAGATPRGASGYRNPNRSYTNSATGRPYLALHVPAGTHRDIAALILAQHAGMLRNTAKSSETDFLTGLTASQFPHITVKQFRWLADIAARCGVTIPTI